MNDELNENQKKTKIKRRKYEKSSVISIRLS